MSESEIPSNAAKGLSEIYKDVGVTKTDVEKQQIISRDFLSSLAKPLLRQMGLSNAASQPVQFFDSACGSGVITQEVQALLSKDLLQKSHFVAGDVSAAMAELVKKRIVEEGWVNTEARVVDAMNTEIPEKSFSHVAISMGLHIIPQPDVAVKDCIRLLKPGGIFGASTPYNDKDWSMWRPDLQSAFASFPFDAPFPENLPAQMHDQGSWADPEWIKEHLQALGLKEVKCQVIRRHFRVQSADHFLFFFGPMLSWLTNGWWSAETRESHPIEEVKELVKEHLIEKYGGNSWDMQWSIVCATGRVE